jgi:hypothetical protein
VKKYIYIVLYRNHSCYVATLNYVVPYRTHLGGWLFLWPSLATVRCALHNTVRVASPMLYDYSVWEQHHPLLVLILSSHLRLRRLNGSFISFWFPHQSLQSATCPAQLILLDMTTLIIFRDSPRGAAAERGLTAHHAR